MFRSRSDRRSLRTATWAALGALSLVCGTAASAQDGPGFVVPFDGEVSVTFDQQGSGVNGALYFVGWETDGSITPATSSGSAYGQLLFGPGRGAQNKTVSLGLFSAGDTLHFLYRILGGGWFGQQGGTLSTADESTSGNFIVSSVSTDRSDYTASLGVETSGGSDRSDWDYTDAEYTLTATPRVVPAPGPIALGACGLALTLFGRKSRRG